MASTIGARTKVYLGLADETELPRSPAPSTRRQVVLTATWLLTGIVIWCVWSVTFGSWIVDFGLIVLVLIPIARIHQRGTDERRGGR